MKFLIDLLYNICKRELDYMNLRFFIILLSCLCISQYSMGSEPAPVQEKPIPNSEANQKSSEAKEQPEPLINKGMEQHKKVIEEYKKYLSTVPENVRDEIREYRKSVIKINKQKIALYKKLSQEAQSFLTEERKYKKKLPFKERKQIKIGNGGK